jgi:hypothetical protein
MKIWFDTEYHQGGRTLDLISLGAVAEDGREFYAISTEFEEAALDPWVKEHVLPHLELRSSPVWKPLSAIKEEFIQFVGPEPPEFWSFVATYDWLLILQMFPGGMGGLPENWPMECWDLNQWAWHLGSPELPEHTGQVHHALADAHWHRQVYEFLLGVERIKLSLVPLETPSSGQVGPL